MNCCPSLTKPKVISEIVFYFKVVICTVWKRTNTELIRLVKRLRWFLAVLHFFLKEQVHSWTLRKQLLTRTGCCVRETVDWDLAILVKHEGEQFTCHLLLKETDFSSPTVKPLVPVNEDRRYLFNSTTERYLQRCKSEDSAGGYLFHRILKTCFLSFTSWKGARKKMVRMLFCSGWTGREEGHIWKSHNRRESFCEKWLQFK